MQQLGEVPADTYALSFFVVAFVPLDARVGPSALIAHTALAWTARIYVCADRVQSKYELVYSTNIRHRQTASTPSAPCTML